MKTLRHPFLLKYHDFKSLHSNVACVIVEPVQWLKNAVGKMCGDEILLGLYHIGVRTLYVVLILACNTVPPRERASSAQKYWSGIDIPNSHEDKVPGEDMEVRKTRIEPRSELHLRRGAKLCGPSRLGRVHGACSRISYAAS